MGKEFDETTNLQLSLMQSKLPQQERRFVPVAAEFLGYLRRRKVTAEDLRKAMAREDKMRKIVSILKED